MNVVVVDQLLRGPLSERAFAAALREHAWCRQIYGVEHVESLIDRAGERLTCIFRAPDQEAVRTVARRLHLPYERVWSARLVRT